jgi:hypothetical protein
MENKMDYLVADENCRIALRELMFSFFKTNLLKDYTKLFKKVSVQPTQDLPNIANANFDGVNYPFISEFHRGYQLVMQDLSN